MRQFSSKILTKIAIGIMIVFIGIAGLGLQAFAEDKPVETPISDIEDTQESSPTPESTHETTPEPSDDMNNIDENVNSAEENGGGENQTAKNGDEAVNVENNVENEQNANENDLTLANANTSIITLDPNGGTLDNNTTITATTGSTYGMISGEQTFNQNSDGYSLGYANYDFGSKITVSIKLKFTNYDTDCFEFLDNFETGGFGFGRGTRSWSDSKEIFYFSVYVNNQYTTTYIYNDLKPGETYWITGVYDGDASRFGLYVNGEKRTDARIVNPYSGSETQNFSGPIKTSNEPVLLNGNPDHSSWVSWKTNMTTYKAGIWTTAMSQEQITDMVSNDYINSDALINVDYTPRRPGCTFEGWYEDLNDSNSKITADTKITKDTTLYAKWALNEYYIDLNCSFDGTYNTELSHAKADVYINEVKVASEVTDYYKKYPSGTKYKIVITPDTGYSVDKTVWEGTIENGNAWAKPTISLNQYENTIWHYAGGFKCGEGSSYGKESYLFKKRRFC